MPRKPVAPSDSPPRGTEHEWRRWMATLGQDFRRVRQFLGLSQDELAKHAGVSQGAVSRLESGRGIHTPFFVLVQINVVLASALKQLDEESLTDEIRGFLAFMTYLAPPRFRGDVPESAPPLRVSRDAALERLIRCYNAFTERQRAMFVAVLDAMASALEGRDDLA